MRGVSPGPVTKGELRRTLLDRRAARSPASQVEAAAALVARVADLPEVGAATVAAAYLSTAGEPGTGPLLAMLHDRGCRVLLPLLLPDFDLAWAPYEPGALRRGRFGLREPTTPSLGPEGVRAASVVVCPALSADLAGHRLGRGGGSYDRVLARLPPGVLRVVLLYDDEVLDAVPTDGHDERVHGIVTPMRTLWSSLPGRP